jgi:hypothetical protein
MAIDLAFRRKAVRSLTNKIGCPDRGALPRGKELKGNRRSDQGAFRRLQKYHRQLLGLAIEVEGDPGDD